MRELVRTHRSALALLDRTFGCEPSGRDCLPASTPDIHAARDGHDIVLSGPIRTSSGIAQVLLLEYLEGMPLADVG